MIARLSRWTLPGLLVVLALGIYRLAYPQPPSGHELAAIQASPTAPQAILPRHDEPRMVTDDQLQTILERMLPPRSGQATTNDWVHALRLWGADVEFRDPGVPSGKMLLNYFLDDAEFRRHAGPSAPPLFTIREDGGVDVRSFDHSSPSHQSTSSFHRDDLLATLAESGVAPQTPLLTRSGTAQVGDLLSASMVDFHPQRLEYEWTVISYARYLHPHGGWRNRYGQTIDVDQLVRQLVQHAAELGPCNGTHRLEAMVVLYRADEQARRLQPATRQLMLGYMREVSRRLVASQQDAGYWTRRWPQGARARTREADASSLDERILVTGHHLEWLALAPEEIQPPRESLVRAGQWLVRTMQEVDDERIRKRYGPFSHAARALCLWRAMEPAQAWSKRAE